MVTNKKLNKNSGLSSLFLFLTTLSLLSACQPTEERQMAVMSGLIMGTTYRITVVSDSLIDQEKLHEISLNEMQAVNDRMSTYLTTSELSEINRTKANKSIRLSMDMNAVLTESQRISELTDGAFDITVGAVVDLWGFGRLGAISKRPSPETLLTLTDSVGYSKISLSGNNLVKQQDHTQLDLSAIAKGYAVDKVAQALYATGISDYLINIGGELRAAGHNVDNKIWRVGIEKPQIIGSIQQIIALNNSAIATSGDYLNFVVFDGQRFSHTIDPTTLSPVLHRLALVSVLHDSTSTADALATAMMVMGEVKAMKFAKDQGLAAYFMIRDTSGDGFEMKKTDKFMTISQ